jgi:alpha-L-rhamnosidase
MNNRTPGCLILFLTWFLFRIGTASALEITHLTCDRAVNPLGITAQHPRLAWILIDPAAGDRGQFQTAYQIVASSSPTAIADDKSDLWDSGKVTSHQSIDVPYAGQSLHSGQLCFWKVRAWDRDGIVSKWSPTVSWTMGVLDPKEWTGQWIGVGDPADSNLRTPRLRREFAIDKPIARAWVYASALGIYDLRLNGLPIGDQYFAPGWTNYRKRIEYQTYDVTNVIHRGGNAMAAQLAPGWYAGNIGWFGPNQYGRVSRLFAELHVEYKDGTTGIVSTDSSWKASAGPVVSSDFQDGEVYDARREQPGWDQPGFDDRAWRAVETGQVEETPRLVAQIDPPMRVKREWEPTDVTEPKPGVFIYRLAQNITGVARVRLHGAPNATVTLRHGEALNADGTLNLITLNSPGIGNARAHNVDTFIFSNESEATFQPRFTWRGFQFIEISGVTTRPSLEEVTGLSIGTDVPDIGDLHTSSELINRINQNTHWSGRDAFMSYPMDCPQRSERLGWAGDANFYLATAVFNFDMSRFYSKWEDDLIDSQSAEGRLCHVAPGGWAGASSEGGYGGGWGDVAVCVPYQLWKNYGDLQVVRDHYEPMTKWISFLQKLTPDLILPRNMAEAGDWQEQRDSTPHELCATAYFAYDVRLLAEMADAIGKKDDAEKYHRLFNDIRGAFANRFIAADGTVGTGSQTAYVLALQIRLVPDLLRDAAGIKLTESIIRHGNQLTTGFVGTQWLLPVLTDIGRTDLAYAVLEQTKKPSWGYMVNHGATTVWENWNVINADGTVNGGANSLNHCAISSCGNWIYENIGGIQLDPLSEAFKSIIIHPRPGGRVTSAEAHYQSPYGNIATAWRVDHGQFSLNVSVPVGASARIMVPAKSSSQVMEGGTPAGTSKEVQFVEMKDHTAVLAVGSGDYLFETKLP